MSLSENTITPRNRVSLRGAVIDALDNLPKDKADEDTGLMKRWPVTKRRVVEFVHYEHSERGWAVAAIGRVYDALRKARKNQAFDDLKTMKRDALEKKTGSVRKRIARAERLAIDHPVVDARDWYGKQAKQLQGQLGLLAWELDRRNQEDATRIETHGYSEGEQAEMLELVDQARPAPAPRKLRPAPSPVETADIGGLVERLRRAKIARAA